MPFRPWYPDPGSYIRYFDKDNQMIKYKRLLWNRDPLKYPVRLPALAAEVKGDAITWKEINPSKDKHHIYLCYVGVKPGFIFYLWHPFDIKNLKWDESIKDITEDLVANISWEESPYEYPTKMIGIQHDRYPALQAKNISGETKVPEAIFIASLYVTIDHEDLPQDDLNRLMAGTLRSYPTDMGGEV